MNYKEEKRKNQKKTEREEGRNETNTLCIIRKLPVLIHL